MRSLIINALQISKHSLRTYCVAPASPPGGVPLGAAAFGVWGAGTGVGKTLVSAGLAAAAAADAPEAALGVLRLAPAVLYLKPLQTGFPADSDGRLVAAAAAALCPSAAALGKHSLGDHAQKALSPEEAAAFAPVAGGAAPLPPAVVARTLFAWRAAVGPHTAVQREGRPVRDSEVLAAIYADLTQLGAAAAVPGAPGAAAHGRAQHPEAPEPLVLVEAAGGVASPGPGSALQVDLLRPLRLPALLVGDSRLGGVSATLCAADALTLRGFDIAAVVFLGGADGAAPADPLRTHPCLACTRPAEEGRLAHCHKAFRPAGRARRPGQCGSGGGSSSSLHPCAEPPCRPVAACAQRGAEMAGCGAAALAAGGGAEPARAAPGASGAPPRALQRAALRAAARAEHAVVAVHAA